MCEAMSKSGAACLFFKIAAFLLFMGYYIFILEQSISLLVFNLFSDEFIDNYQL